MFAYLFLAGLLSSTWASINLHEGPLLPPATAFTFEVASTILFKPETCYITSGLVSQCRRKRGMEERPSIIQFDDDLEVAPSAVLPIETTSVPQTINSLGIFKGKNVVSSFDDSYVNTQNLFRQLAANPGNLITVGNCGQSTVNLSQFLSCLGLTVQETTTLTGTFTETTISTSGYTIMTVLGCTPAGFPYVYCPASVAATVTDLKPAMPPSFPNITDLPKRPFKPRVRV
ncbi:uncharacterized protein LOC130700492 [Daphnia carinata]|uniref:uncharacterized protein LOC130700492 n=1 Tax=Daphnia carinata TaxID=120202 RepID=UPI00257FCFAF|nr:uncharacterized protein LOC130700492 [Daphnia carinata]